MPISPQEIEEMSYPDFVGYINQWNVLPGAYTTLSKWATFSHLGVDSRIIELACTSGFSSRELATLTGCRGIGLDLSHLSVEMARYNLQNYAPTVRLEYQCDDAYTFVPKEKCTHVVVGASLKFFPDPAKIIKRIVSVYLADEGFLLAAPFFITTPIPTILIEQARSVFGITITTESYKEVMCLYKGFEIIYEDRCVIEEETENELRHYCDSTIERACRIRNISDGIVKEAMYNRLMRIKLISNLLRSYQKFSVLVLRYRSSVYPHRYAELF